MWRSLPISQRRIVFSATLVAAFLGLSAAASTIGTNVIERTNPASGRFIPVTGGSLHVVERGPPGGAADHPAIVLVHGAGANLRDQEHALGERLARTRRVLLIDRPGHGWSMPG